MPKLMTNKNVFLLSLLGCVACSNTPIGDRRLPLNEVPAFLSEYKKPEYEDAEFYVKGKKKKTYEVKYLKNDREISLAFDKDGKLLEKEEDTTLNAFPTEVKSKITRYLNKEYPGHKILEVEKRQEGGVDNFIDVEIRHESSKSGYWEVSFDPSGNFVSREVEDYQILETLN